MNVIFRLFLCVGGIVNQQLQAILWEVGDDMQSRATKDLLVSEVDIQIIIIMYL